MEYNNLIINIISVWLIVDGVFCLMLPKHAKKLIKQFFPDINIKQIAIAELFTGIAILLIQLLLHRI